MDEFPTKYFGDTAETRVGFVKFKAECVDRGRPQDTVAGIVLMRGHYTCVFVEITCKETHKRYVIMTQQPRLPILEPDYMEIPRGHVENNNFAGAAAYAIKQAIKVNGAPMEIRGDELVNMSAVEQGSGRVFTSPSITDEGVRPVDAHRTLV